MSGYVSEVALNMKKGCCLLAVNGHHCEKHDVLKLFYENVTDISYTWKLTACCIMKLRRTFWMFSVNINLPPLPLTTCQLYIINVTGNPWNKAFLVLPERFEGTEGSVSNFFLSLLYTHWSKKIWENFNLQYTLTSKKAHTLATYQLKSFPLINYILLISFHAY